MSETSNIRSTDSEIDLYDILFTIWRGKFFISIIVILSFLSSFYYCTKIAVEKFESIAIFGFENSKSNSFSLGEISSIIGFGSSKVDSNNNNLLTEINGKDFIKSVVIELTLQNDPEFYSPSANKFSWSVTGLKYYLKAILNIDETRNYSDSEILDIATKKLKSNNLNISKISSGGYQVAVTTSDPAKSALIANTVTELFLERRLNNKNRKADKTLAYISLKLGEARVVMENAISDVERFTIENNILSGQEFFSQSKRLREFRLSIKEIENQILNLADQKKYFQTATPTNLNLKENLNDLYGMAPRLKPRSLGFNKNAPRDLSLELKSVNKNLEIEISRIKKQLAFTVSGFNKLETEAKKTGSNVRKLDMLKREVAIRTAAYDALLAQFETQSITDGYQEALGEIYQTATPPVLRKSPDRKFILMLSIVVGLLVGCALVILNSIISGRIWSLNKISAYFQNEGVVSVSNKFDKLKSSKLIFNSKKPELYEFTALQGLCIKIKEFQSTNKIKHLSLACATFGNSSAITTALSFAKLLSNTSAEVVLLDVTSNQSKNKKSFEKLTDQLSSSEMEIMRLDNNVSYHPFFFNRAKSPSKEIYKNLDDKKANLLKEHTVLITIVDYLESDTLSRYSIFSSDLYVLIGKGGSFTEKQTMQLKTSLDKKINDCLSFIFIKN
mgnify:CR=1 FL=1